MRKILLCSCIAALISIVLVSCRRDNDGDSQPEITLSSPAGGSFVHVLDTIAVSVTVSDDNGLSDISVRLSDASLTPVLPAFTQQISGKSAHLEYAYPVNDEHLSSGLYYLVIEAKDNGGNISRVYRDVQLVAVPVVRKGFFVTTVPNAATVELHKIDSANNASVIQTYSGDYLGLALSARWQQVYTSGNITGALHAYSINNVNAGWTENPVVSAAPYFTGIQTTGDRLIMSYQSGVVRGYDAGHQQRLMVNMPQGFHARKTFLSASAILAGNLLFAEMEDVNAAVRKFAAFNASNGGSLQECLLNGTIVDMFQRDSSSLIVLANDNGQGKVYVYDISANGFWEPISLPSGATVNSAAQVNTNQYLLAMSNGTVYRFDMFPLGLLTVAPINASRIRYDASTNEFITAEGTALRRYNFASSAFIGNVATFSNPITDFEIWYNR